MAVYNGETYLEQQLNSLLEQTYFKTHPDFKIYIRDDGSTDQTVKIISEYILKYPGKIILKIAEKNSGSAKYNFLKLMLDVKDDYIFLCDQDDVWLPEKVEISMTEMKKLEETYGDTPLMVHTDLRVVDENLNVVSESFREAMNANWVNCDSLNQVVIMNTITGCTVVYNRKLAELILKPESFIVMHDWWLYLIGATFGHIGHCFEKTILYRQHGKNSIGAKDVRTLSYKINRLFNNKEIKSALDGSYRQADAFLKTYSDKLSDKDKELLTRFSNIPKHKKFKRYSETRKLGTFKHGFARKIAQFLFI
jgi:glycosyltransferase involved in cell wall biosynthesis